MLCCGHGRRRQAKQRDGRRLMRISETKHNLLPIRRLRLALRGRGLVVRFAMACIGLAVEITSPASAQSALPPFEAPSRPGAGGVGIPIPSQPPVFGPAGGTEILRHRGPTGKPCLSIDGSARRHAANANVYDHVIFATNGCAQRITMQVCYYKSQECIPMEVPGYGRKEAVLGTLPSMKEFRFEFREKF
jgi:hypothetical protein